MIAGQCGRQDVSLQNLLAYVLQWVKQDTSCRAHNVHVSWPKACRSFEAHLAWAFLHAVSKRETGSVTRCHSCGHPYIMEAPWPVSITR